MPKNFESFFKNKKITLVGLGLLGRGVADAEFLAQQGAVLTVTDLKNAEQLAPSFLRLKQFPSITYHLGGHRMEDFRDKDFVLKAAGVPLDSPYIAEARRNGIPIEMDASLFAKLAPKGVTIVGVTGTRGKSTTTALIYEMIKASGKRVFLAGNIKDKATLPLLKEVKAGDYVVLELDSWQLQGFGDAKLSPHISVFTTFYPDHMNYYGGSMDHYFADKANIFKYQKQRDFLVVGEQASSVREFPKTALCARSSDVPKLWKIQLLGEHNRLNIACAVTAARALHNPDTVIREAVESFSGLPGRLEFLREINGVKIYNDNSATTPEATLAALRALGSLTSKLGVKLPSKKLPSKIVLIMGGDDKKLDMSGLIQEVPKWCSKVVLFKERGTDLVREKVFALKKEGVEVYEEEGMEATVRRAFGVASPGETILYSPAFSSFGQYFKNEYERGEQFTRIVNSL